MYNKRILAALITVFLVGVIIAIICNTPDTVFFRAVIVLVCAISVILAILFLYVIRVNNSKQIAVAAFAVAALSFGVLRIVLYDDSLSDYAKYGTKSDTAVFSVVEINRNYIDTKLISDSLGVPKNTIVRLYPNIVSKDLIYGDILTAEVKYRTVRNNAYLGQNIKLLAYCEITDTQDGKGVIHTVRESISENTEVLYSDFEYAPAVAKGVIIGDRTDIDSYFYAIYKTAGITHILSISGLHITLIAMSIYNVLKFVGVNRHICSVLGAITAIFYAVLVGLPAGAFRSAVMISVFLISRLFLCNSDGITTLFIALFLLIIINPYAICSIGLQLSFLCTLGIVLTEPLLNRISAFFVFKKRRSYSKLKNKTLDAIPALFAPIIISFVSSVFSLPILFFGFDTVSYISLITNLIIVPVFNVAVGLAFISFLTALISPAIGMIFSIPAGLIFEYVTEFSKLAYDHDVGSVSVYAEYMFIPVALSIAIIVVYALFSFQNVRLYIALFSAFCISFVFCVTNNIHALENKSLFEYGSSESEYVFASSSNNSVYIDMGGWTSSPDSIFKNGETALDNYVIISYDDYTYNRFDYMSGTLKISKLYVPKANNIGDYDIFLQIRELANRRNCDIITFDEELQLALDTYISVSLYAEYNSLIDGNLICIDMHDMKIRIPGSGFDNRISCDIAIASSDYNGDFDKIMSNESFASTDYLKSNSDAKRYFTEFNERLSIEFNHKESDYKVYES